MLYTYILEYEQYYLWKIFSFHKFIIFLIQRSVEKHRPWRILRDIFLVFRDPFLHLVLFVFHENTECYWWYKLINTNAIFICYWSLFVLRIWTLYNQCLSLFFFFFRNLESMWLSLSKQYFFLLKINSIIFLLQNH